MIATMHQTAMLRIALSLTFASVFLLSASTSSRADGDSGAVQWNKDKGTSTFIQVPGNGGWTSSNAITPQDSQIYKYTQECVTGGQDNSNFDGAYCAAISASQCTDGENGQMVQWYSALAGFEPPAWRPAGSPTCVYDQKPVDILEQIAAQIQTAFQQQPVNAGTLVSQPGLDTLKGAQTNFVVEALPQTFDITLLGQRVRINATPVAYTFDYGDGTKLGPTVAAGITLSGDNVGQKTPTSHAYQDTLDYNARVTTTFNGTYSVNGSPAVAIPGQGNFDTNTVTLRVWRSTTKWVDQNCLQNPTGWACPADQNMR